MKTILKNYFTFVKKIPLIMDNNLLNLQVALFNDNNLYKIYEFYD